MTRQKSSKKHIRLREQYVPTSWGKNELYPCEELKVTQRGAKYHYPFKEKLRPWGPYLLPSPSWGSLIWSALCTKRVKAAASGVACCLILWFLLPKPGPCH